MEWLPSVAEAPRGGRRRWALVAVIAAVAIVGGAGLALGWRAGARPVSDQALAKPDRNSFAVPAQFAAITGQVADVRGLPLQREVRTQVTQRDTFADTVERLALTEDAREELRSRERFARTLGLLGPEVDLEALSVALYRDQAVGLYSPEEATLFVGTPDGRMTPSLAWAVAHETVHALQDQSFGVDGFFRNAPAEVDARAASLSVLEGDAVVTQEVWSRRFQTLEERGTLLGPGADPTVTSAGFVPRYVRQTFTFPYESGAQFVAAILEDGGYPALDEVYANPPTTTEQIIHPAKYRSGERPIPVSSPGGAGVPWVPDLDETFGEAELQRVLQPLGDQASARLAQGWGGGRLRTWTRGESTAIAVNLVMDTDADAAELCAGVEDWWAAAQGEGVMQHRCDGREIHIGIGPDQATAEALVGGSTKE